MNTNEIRLCRAFSLSGVLGAVFYLLHDVVGAMNYPSYEWMRQAVSDLTATDAPSYLIAGGLSSVYGILSCVCCLFVCVLAARENKPFRWGIGLFTAMSFVSAAGYSLFPLSGAGYGGSMQSFMHVYIITTAVVLLSIVSLVLIAVGAFRGQKKLLGVLAITALAAMFVGAVGSANVPQDYFGLVERFSTYSAVIFTAVLGVFSFRDML